MLQVRRLTHSLFKGGLAKHKRGNLSFLNLREESERED